MDADLSDVAEPGAQQSLARADAPRVWSAPPEPGPEVTAVTDRNGQKWKRHDGGWCFVGPRLGHHHWRWSELFFRQAPLYDATPEPAAAPSVRHEDSTAGDSGTSALGEPHPLDLCCSPLGCGHHINGHGHGSHCTEPGCACRVWRDHVNCEHRAAPITDTQEER